MEILEENRPLFIELCYIANKRNLLNLKRQRARYKKHYYKNAISVLEAHNKSNSKLRFLKSRLEHTPIKTAADVHLCADLQSQISRIELSMKLIVQQNPKPTKWKKMGLHKLRSLALKYEGEYAAAKHEMMELSLSTRSRVRELLKKLNASLKYNNGSVEYVVVDTVLSSNSTLNEYVFKDDIKKYADQHELNLVVEEILDEEVLSSET